MYSNLKMQMRWAARPAYTPYLVAARDTLADLQNDAGGVEMAVE